MLDRKLRASFCPPPVPLVMYRLTRIALLFITALVVFLAGCSKKDRVVAVADDDPDMIAAVAEARAALPQFWRLFARPRGTTDFSLKVKITDQQGTEHFWLTEIERTGGRVFGTINNDPEIVRSVQRGERIPVSEADISDWLYMRNGKIIGNYTLGVMVKKMPVKAADNDKQRLAKP